MSSTEYAGILAIVATIFVVMFALDLDSKVGTTVRTALCQILGGQCGDPQAAAPEKCLTGKTTTSANANVFVAFVQIDKDSILIREDYSDGSSKFTIVDNTEAAGKLLAGAKAKAGKYGFNASAEALRGRRPGRRQGVRVRQPGGREELPGRRAGGRRLRRHRARPGRLRRRDPDHRRQEPARRHQRRRRST